MNTRITLPRGVFVGLNIQRIYLDKGNTPSRAIAKLRKMNEEYVGEKPLFIIIYDTYPIRVVTVTDDIPAK